MKSVMQFFNAEDKTKSVAAVAADENRTASSVVSTDKVKPMPTSSVEKVVASEVTLEKPTDTPGSSISTPVTTAESHEDTSKGACEAAKSEGVIAPGESEVAKKDVEAKKDAAAPSKDASKDGKDGKGNKGRAPQKQRQTAEKKTTSAQVTPSKKSKETSTPQDASSSLELEKLRQESIAMRRRLSSTQEECALLRGEVESMVKQIEAISPVAAAKMRESWTPLMKMLASKRADFEKQLEAEGFGGMGLSRGSSSGRAARRNAQWQKTRGGKRREEAAEGGKAENSAAAGMGGNRKARRLRRKNRAEGEAMNLPVPGYDTSMPVNYPHHPGMNPGPLNEMLAAMGVMSGGNQPLSQPQASRGRKRGQRRTKATHPVGKSQSHPEADSIRAQLRDAVSPEDMKKAIARAESANMEYEVKMGEKKLLKFGPQESPAAAADKSSAVAHEGVGQSATPSVV